MTFASTIQLRVCVATLFAVLAIGAAGCSGTIGHLMVDAPNSAESAASLGESSETVLRTWGVDRQFRIQVGPPAASLLVWVIDPIAESGAPNPAPKGTVLVLHGFRDEMEWFTCKGRALARHGYRAVMVDLRGQGSSTGEFLTFGVQESKDVVGLIDALTQRAEISGPIGVWGMSYGASTAIMAGTRDDRIKAVVAVAPFESMRRIVPHFVRLLVPVAGWLMSDEQIDALVSERAKHAGFDPDESDMANAAAAGKSPLLLLHGAWDVMVPASHSEHIELAARDAGREVRRVVVPLTGHVSIYFDVADVVEDESVAWFDRWLATEWR
jgi:pimeloyl-ACP methyl ester carboxylesterase